jgi:hypothetical protein
MEVNIHSEICLDIAVDHRIRALCKPVIVSSREPSKHISRIETLGRSLGRSQKEIQVTAELAGPAIKGGIAITLQQPRDNHPFEEGIDNVIADCDTLYALYEIFPVVSCGSIDIRSDIRILDLLPYMSDDTTEVDDTDLKEFFDQSAQAICDMEPDVLLCAGKIWLSKFDKFNKIKGEARKLESIGLERKFGQHPKLPVQARIPRGDGSFVSIKRVNGFHPSHALNYRTHVSLLRQLLIMVCAEACGMFRDDWEDKEWMMELRSRCQELSAHVGKVKISSPSHLSSSRRSFCAQGDLSPQYIPEYQKHHLDTLHRLKNAAIPLLSESRPVRSLRTNYDTLLSSNLSETCNDASLILRRMNDLFDDVGPDSMAWLNGRALKTSAKDTKQVMRSLLEAAKQADDQQLSSIIQQGANSILSCVAVNKLKLEEASNAFLKLATNIETLLSDLLLEKERTLVFSQQEEMLSSRMGTMTLAPDLAK